MDTFENEGTVEAEQTLIATYIADSNYAVAASKLAAMPLENPYVADWVTLNQILLSLYENDKSLYELDSMDVVFIRDLAYKCPAGLGTANAQAILQLLYREEVPECPEYMSTKSVNIKHAVDFTGNVDIKDDIVLGENYPEPASSYTNIPYYLPEGVTGKIFISDICGRIVSEYDVYSGENTIFVDTKNQAAGVYTYTLSLEGLPLITKKMVIGK